jgi:hypothetical protein
MTARAAPLVLAFVAACARTEPTPPTPRPVVVVQVPADAGSSGFDPRTRFPDGSRVAVIDLARPVDPPRTLSDGLAAAGGVAVRWDAARVAFVARENGSDRFAVYTCAPDGSGRIKSVEAAADCGSAAFLADGRLAFSLATPQDGWALFVDKEGGGAPRRITFSGGADVDPTPLPDGRIAFASRAQGATEFGLFAVHVDGTGVGPLWGAERTRALLLPDDDARSSDPAWRTIQCVPLAPTRKPQGHLSVVDDAKPWGDVFCVDARAPGATHARHVRFTRLDGPARAMGDVPLAADGSFFVRLPPDAPLGLELLDEAGRVVAAQRAPFWVRPGETRGCIGCHEPVDAAPPNVRPLAVLSAAVPIAVDEERAR